MTRWSIAIVLSIVGALTVGPSPALAHTNSAENNAVLKENLPLITSDDFMIRKTACQQVMAADPSGKAIIDTIREALKKPPGDHYDPYLYALGQVGERAVPLLIELSSRPDMNTRFLAVHGIRSICTNHFNQDAADRMVDMYFESVADLPEGKSNHEMWEKMMRSETSYTLEKMGPEGAAMKSKLAAGNRPTNERRQKMAAEINVPDSIKAALFPTDSSASVSSTQYAVIQELAALYNKGDEQAVIRRAGELADRNNEEATRVIAGRLLTVLPGVGDSPEGEAGLIQALGVKDSGIRLAICGILLGGKTPCSPAVQSAISDLIDKGPDIDHRIEAIDMLAKFHNGRRVIIENLPINDFYRVGFTTRAAMALSRNRPELGAVLGTGERNWRDATAVAALKQLLLTIEDHPKEIIKTLAEQLNSPDASTAAMAASALRTDAYFSRLGPVTAGRVAHLNLNQNMRYDYSPLIMPQSNGPLAVSPNNPGGMRSPFIFKPVPLPAIYPVRVSNACWMATGLFVSLLLLGLAGWLIFPTRRSVAN